MAKHIKAPKTYDPGKGRPLEHLAYLNTREMDYLRRINGNNMERGPKNLPSFPPDDSLGSSSKSGSKSSGKSSGPGGPSGPNSGPSRGGGDKGVGGGTRSTSKSSGPGGPSGPNSGPSKTSGSGFRGAGGNRPSVGSGTSNRDASIRDSLARRDSFSTVRNTPAIKNDGVTGFRAQALGAKPLGGINAPKKTYSSQASVPVERDIEITRNLDKIKESFYKNDPDYQKALKSEIGKVAKVRESVGLLGTGISPRDTLSAPARTAPSTKMTPGEWQALADKYNPVKAAGRLASGIGALATNVYRDPVGSALGALEGFGQYSKDTLNTIGAAATSSDPDVQNAAAEKAAEVAMNFGLLGGVVGGATTPTNTLGMWAGKMSRDPEVQKAIARAESLAAKGAPPSDIFNETAKKSASYIGGVSIAPFSGNKWMAEIADPLNLKNRGLADTVKRAIAGESLPSGASVRLGDVIEYGPTLRSHPSLANMPLKGGIDDLVFEANGTTWNRHGSYNPANADLPDYGSFNPGLYGESLVINHPPALSVPQKISKAMSNKPLGRAFRNSSFKDTLAHELGHAVAQREGFPQGTNPDYLESVVKTRPSTTGLTADHIRKLAEDMYKWAPGEYMARMMSDRRTFSGDRIKDWKSGFVNSIPQEDFEKMLWHDIMRRSLVGP